jgi:hypothetical protein
VPASQLTIALFSPELQEKLAPARTPFVAHYHHGRISIDYVAARHIVTADNPTTRAIAHCFDQLEPEAVILEGFPTAAGSNPPYIVESARRRTLSDATTYERSEPVYAASIAIERGIPFIGGEPTEKEELAHLNRRGYTTNEVALAFLIRVLGQAHRGGEFSTGDAAAFAAAFERARLDKLRIFGPTLLTLSEFQGRYRASFGVDPASDPHLEERGFPGTATRQQRLSAEDMRFRDQHILDALEQQLRSHQRVLVIYGASHWTTESFVLRARYGPPRMSFQ